jgi:hypothetical protein
MPTTLTFPILRLPFTDVSNTHHPDAVWYLASIAQDAIDLDAGLQFYGYDNADDLTIDLKAALGGGVKYTPIGQKSYSLSMPQFAQLANAPSQAGVPLMSTEFQDAVGFAQSVLDTPVLNADGTPAPPNADGTPQMRSFFAGATVDSVQVTY